MGSGIGFDPVKSSRDTLTSADFVWAGSLSSAGTRVLCQPLDVLKIRFQLQVESKLEAKYRNIFQALGLIYKEEGIKGFWKGHIPAQTLSIVYGGCQFYTFEYLTKLCYSIAPWTTDSRFKPSVHVVVGGLAGIAGTLTSYPFDVVRTRLVAQKVKRYQGTVHAASQMMRNEGIGSFFKGVVPTFATIAPYSGLQFGFYTLCSNILRPFVTEFSEELGEWRITHSGSLLCGAMAGFSAKILVFPFDTTKKRLQILGFQEGRKGMGGTGNYSGMVDCLRKIVQMEGYKGLFKGLTPGLIKAVATTSINFWLYEMTIILIASCKN